MPFTDVRRLTEQQRWAAADRARDPVAAGIPPIKLPPLRLWNYLPCSDHAELTRGCTKCGANFRKHQHQGIAWMYLAKHGLLGDSCGTGKTIQVAGLLAMMAEAGELGTDEYAGQRRAVVIARAAAVDQWKGELNRFVPSLRVITATEDQKKRAIKYLDPWDVCIISAPMLASRRNQDYEWLEQHRLGLVVYDDVDAMRNPDNRTAYAVKKLCETSPRAIGLHATPLQKRVMELWSFLEPVGGREVLGSSEVCRHRFVRKRSATFFVYSDQLGRNVQRTIVTEEGINNGAEFRRLITPLVLRRSAADLDDVEMPEIQPNVVWLDPTPAQRRRYDELRRGVLVRLNEEGIEHRLTRPQAMAQFMHGWQICSGLATLDQPELGTVTGRLVLPERAHSSAKLDWALDRITGDFSDDKVVVFINFKPNIADMAARLERAGVGYVVIWGSETNMAERSRRLKAFREDPNCRVLIGTTSIEQSLNLQVARHLIAVDTIINPARMTQLAGRIQRDGSPFQTVYMHQLLFRGTQEERILEVLRREQAIADYVWGEQSEIFEALSPMQLMRLITGDPELAGRAA